MAVWRLYKSENVDVVFVRCGFLQLPEASPCCTEVPTLSSVKRQNRAGRLHVKHQRAVQTQIRFAASGFINSPFCTMFPVSLRPD